ncbi:hypothetical protein GCM10028803_31220 [Larkinella knui]|nr:amine oxidase [Larkinella knui]
MGGYECTDKLNAWGNRVDFLHTTGHLQLIDDDYRDLHSFNIRTVREGIRWSQVETRPYQYDWNTVAYMMERGRRAGIQQVWDLCHFGFPDDLTPLHPLFARRFAALCRAFVEFYRSIDPDSTLIVTPINEVSFLSWLGGDARGTSPYCVGQGWEVKYHLMRAYIEGVAALRQADPAIRILTTEPLVNMVPVLQATPEQVAVAAHEHQNQFQATDMLSGRMCPELGGKPEYLDLVGLNFYYNNQWVVGTGEFLPWANDGFDPRWVPLRDLFMQVYERYQRPIVLSETSHPGEDRPLWIRFVGDESAAVIRKGIPLWGICLYPIIDRPDWDHLDPWHQAGLWDAEVSAEGVVTQDPPRRVLNQPYAEALRDVQAALALAQTATTGITVSGLGDPIPKRVQ